MTRDEAIQKVKAVLCPDGCFYSVPNNVLREGMNELVRNATQAVDIAVALGLKLDEPKTVESEAHMILVRAVGCIEASLAHDALKKSGFKIVRSD